MGSGDLPTPVASALDRFARAVRDRFGARVFEVVLFGSYARGEATEDSDVDVLVVIDELADAEALAIVDLATEIKLASADWVGLSPLVLSTEKVRQLRQTGRSLWRDIATEGRAL
jgi:predicted nucleotidyltransferase